jgi:hypothetical protein
VRGGEVAHEIVDRAQPCDLHLWNRDRVLGAERGKEVLVVDRVEIELRSS